MADENGLIWCYVVRQDGTGEAVEFNKNTPLPEREGVTWVHLDYSAPAMQQWIARHSGLPALAQSLLLAEQARPRSLMIDGGLSVIFRGVNLNAGADPDDMVALRLWLTEDLIISARQRKLMSAEDVRHQIDQANGPEGAGDFLVRIAGQITDRMADVIEGVDDEISSLEDEVLKLQSYELRARIAEVRRQCINLRRYLAPQREAVSRLFAEKISWLSEADRIHLREVADRTVRYIEDLDSARERASVAQEELMSKLSEQMDKRMYVLSVVAALFLPLGFLTGLLGVNVGGIPGTENQSAFLIFSLILIVVTVLQIVIFRWKAWF